MSWTQNNEISSVRCGANLHSHTHNTLPLDACSIFNEVSFVNPAALTVFSILRATWLHSILNNVSSIKIVWHVWPDAVDPQRGYRWTDLPRLKKFNREHGITEHKVKITSPRSDRAWALGRECRVHECFLFRQTDDRGNTRHVLHHHTSNRLRHTAKEPLQIPKVWLWFTWEWNSGYSDTSIRMPLLPPKMSKSVLPSSCHNSVTRNLSEVCTYQTRQFSIRKETCYFESLSENFTLIFFFLYTRVRSPFDIVLLLWYETPNK